MAVFDFTVGTVHPFDLPKTAVSRALAWVIAAIIGIAISRYGLHIIPSTRLHLLIVAYLAANALSASLAADSYVAAFGDQERRLGLSYLLDMAVLYLAVAVALRSESDALPLLSGFTLGAAVAIGYGIVQVLKLDPFAWSLGNARPLSTLGNPNMYGQFLSVAFGVGLGLMLAPGVVRRRLLSALAILMMAASLAVAATVATRGTVLGVIASLAVAPLVYVKLHRAGPARAAAAALVTTAAGLGLGAIGWGTPLGARVEATIRGFQIEDRLSVWHSGLLAFAERPIFGWGPDAFRVAYPAYRPPDGSRIFGLNYTADSAHNWLLQAMVTSGIVGAAALLAAAGGFHYALWRRGMPKAPVLGGALLLGSAAWWANGLVTVGMIGVDWWPWIMFGGTAGLVGRQTSVNTVHRQRSVAVVAVTAAIVGAFSPYLALDADHWMYRASSRSDSEAVDFAQRGVDRDPGRAEHWNQLGLSLYSQMRWKDSGDAFAAAARRAPYDATFWLNLAKARAQETLHSDRSSGGADQAMSAARRAIATEPNDPSIQAGAAAVAIALGDADFAVVAGARAVRLAPGVASFEQTLASGARAATNRKATLGELSRVPSLRDSRLLTVVAAEVALSAGMLEDARMYASRALELDPQDAQARELLRRAGG